MEAAYYQKDMVRFLISEGADVNKLSDNGWIVLDGAIDEGRLDIAELLPKHGAKE
jgi:ankyrin repeat protein